jgi:hypothetical protein
LVGCVLSRPVRWIADIMIFVLGAAAYCATAEAAELLILAGSDAEFIRDCAQQDVVISGNRSKFVLAGGCHSLSVPGDGNHILVEFGAESELYLRGNDNRIAWKTVPGAAEPTVTMEGRSNNIVQFPNVTAKAEIPNLGDHGVTPPASVVPSVTNNPVNGAVRTDGKSEEPEKQAGPEKLAGPKKKITTKSPSGKAHSNDPEFVLNFDAGLSPNVRRCDHPRGADRARCQNLAPTAADSTSSGQHPVLLWHIFSDDSQKPPAGHSPSRTGRAKPQ